MMEPEIVVAVVMALVEALKRKAGLSTRFAPVASLVLAGLVNTGNAWLGDGDLLKGLLDGLMLGLVASGVYSGAKATLFNA